MLTRVANLQKNIPTGLKMLGSVLEACQLRLGYDADIRTRHSEFETA